MSEQPKRMWLSKTQAKTYNYMVVFFRANDQLPPTRMIADHFRWKSQTAAMSILNVLKKKEWIEHNDAGKYRFIRPLCDGSTGVPLDDA